MWSKLSRSGIGSRGLHLLLLQVVVFCLLLFLSDLFKVGGGGLAPRRAVLRTVLALLDCLVHLKP